MTTLDFIGFNSKSADKTVKELQQLLADMQVFYTNLRNFHWNIQGELFFTLHEKFEEIYDEVNEQIDQVAERILSLGGVPQNKFSEYLKISNVKEEASTSTLIDTVTKTLAGFKTIIAQERKVIAVSQEGDDEVTADIMTEYLTGQEKTVWMLVAFLKK